MTKAGGILHQRWRNTREYKNLRHVLLSKHHNGGFPVRCVICDVILHGNYPSIHHSEKGYDSFENFVNPENVICVCGFCHAWIHGKL